MGVNSFSCEKLKLMWGLNSFMKGCNETIVGRIERCIALEIEMRDEYWYFVTAFRKKSILCASNGNEEGIAEKVC